VVFARGKGLTATDMAAVSSARGAVGRLAGQPSGVSTPSPVQRSADGQAALFTHEHYLDEIGKLIGQGSPPDPAAIAEIRARNDIQQLTMTVAQPR
jgi:hypothetical protein